MRVHLTVHCHLLHPYSLQLRLTAYHPLLRPRFPIALKSMEMCGNPERHTEQRKQSEDLISDALARLLLAVQLVSQV